MEYCIADSIYHLSNNPKSEIKGWCFATKETIANILGTTSRNIFNVIPKLIKKGFVEKSKDTRGYLRTTQKWYENVVIIRMKAEYEEVSQPMKKLHNDYERTSQPIMKKLHTHNNNNNYNYKKKRISSSKKLKPYFRGEEMRFSKGRWFVIPADGGTWINYVGREKDIEWK